MEQIDSRTPTERFWQDLGWKCGIQSRKGDCERDCLEFWVEELAATDFGGFGKQDEDCLGDVECSQFREWFMNACKMAASIPGSNR